jgi:hypothetical protein
MHQYLAFVALFLGIELHPRFSRQRKVFLSDLQLQRPHSSVLLLGAVAIKQLKLAWACLFASEVAPGPHHFYQTGDVSRRDKSVAKSSVESQLLSLNLDSCSVHYFHTAERDSPTIVNDRSPNNIGISCA